MARLTDEQKEAFKKKWKAAWETKEEMAFTSIEDDVYEWPEFKAFAERLGIPTDELPTRCVTIRIPYDDVVTVTHEYLDSDTKDGAPSERMEAYKSKRPVLGKIRNSYIRGRTKSGLHPIL